MKAATYYTTFNQKPADIRREAEAARCPVFQLLWRPRFRLEFRGLWGGRGSSVVQGSEDLKRGFRAGAAGTPYPCRIARFYVLQRYRVCILRKATQSPNQLAGITQTPWYKDLNGQSRRSYPRPPNPKPLNPKPLNPKPPVPPNPKPLNPKRMRRRSLLAFSVPTGRTRPRETGLML